METCGATASASNASCRAAGGVSSGDGGVQATSTQSANGYQDRYYVVIFLRISNKGGVTVTIVFALRPPALLWCDAARGTPFALKPGSGPADSTNPEKTRFVLGG